VTAVIPAQNRRIDLYEGSTFDRTWTITKSDGDLRDLTGWSAALQVRKDFASATKLLDLASAVFTPPAADGIVLGGTAGTVRVYVRDETMAALNAADFDSETDNDGAVTYFGVWDLELTNPAGETFRYMQGRAFFSPEVTR
jgi:hypothetical protein